MDQNTAVERVPCYHGQHTRPTKERAPSAARQTEAGSMGHARCEEYSETVSSMGHARVVQEIQQIQCFSSSLPNNVGFQRAWSAVTRRKAIPWLLARCRDFERPEHVPRRPPGTHTCTVVYRRVPCVPRSRREKRPAWPEEKSFAFRNSQFYT